jgi:hypothetical protein
MICEALDVFIGAKLHAIGMENSLGRACLMQIPGHLVLLTVGLPLYLTYGIRIGTLPPKFGK